MDCEKVGAIAELSTFDQLALLELICCGDESVDY